MYKKGSARRTRRFPRIRGTFHVQGGSSETFFRSGLGLRNYTYCYAILFSVNSFFFLSFFLAFFPSFLLSSFWQIDFGFFLDGSRDRGRRSVDNLGSVQSSPMEILEIYSESFFDDQILYVKNFDIACGRIISLNSWKFYSIRFRKFVKIGK